MFSNFTSCKQSDNETKKLEITREEYDHWRYTYPAVEAQRTRDELDVLREKRKAAETEE